MRRVTELRVAEPPGYDPDRATARAGTAFRAGIADHSAEVARMAEPVAVLGVLSRAAALAREAGWVVTLSMETTAGGAIIHMAANLGAASREGA